MLSGFLIAGTGALMFVNADREASLEQLHRQRAAARISDFYQLLRQSAPKEQLETIPGIRLLASMPSVERNNPGLARVIRERMPGISLNEAASASLDLCYPLLRSGLSDVPPRREWRIRPPSCWVVRIEAPMAAILAIETPMTVVNEAPLFDLRFLSILAIGALLVSLVVAKAATAPLARLRQAAVGFGEDVGQPPISEDGPSEVREAARAFNRMQARLCAHIEERAIMLAAISHDLQTPMTCVRLRLEGMDEGGLRQLLLRDWYAMRTLVEEGLRLARAAHERETRIVVDLDSLIDTVVTDATDSELDVTYSMRTGIELMLAPESIGRALANLVNNAAIHGGKAEICVRTLPDAIILTVLDNGPGIPEEQIELMMQPFSRGKTGGTGLGLSIARVLAERNGARLMLANRPEGGLAATLTIHCPGWDEKR